MAMFALGIMGPAAESMRILGDNFADDNSVFGQWCWWCDAFCGGDFPVVLCCVCLWGWWRSGVPGEAIVLEVVNPVIGLIIE
jgi:hypothetical protein